MNSGQKIQFLEIELASFPDKKSNKNSKVQILGFELASSMDKKQNTFWKTVAPWRSQNYFFQKIRQTEYNSRWIFCPEMTLPDVPKIHQIGVKNADSLPNQVVRIFVCSHVHILLRFGHGFSCEGFVLWESLWWHWYQKTWMILASLLINVKSLIGDAHLPIRLRKN